MLLVVALLFEFGLFGWASAVQSPWPNFIAQPHGFRVQQEPGEDNYCNLVLTPTSATTDPRSRLQHWLRTNTDPLEDGPEGELRGEKRHQSDVVPITVSFKEEIIVGFCPVRSDS